MIDIQITRLSEYIGSPNYGSIVSEIKRIFFETTSRTKFKDDRDRANFFELWTKYYFDHHSDLIFLASESSTCGRLAGYLTGSDDSIGALSFYSNRLESYEIFKEFYRAFPAHLHINCSLDRQGKGIGQQLMGEFLNALKNRKSPGVHLVTTPTARNVDFYKKIGFDFTVEKDFRGNRLLFMGKSLILQHNEI